MIKYEIYCSFQTSLQPNTYMFGFVGLFGESKTSKKGGIIYADNASPILESR